MPGEFGEGGERDTNGAGGHTRNEGGDFIFFILFLFFCGENLVV